MALLGSRFIIDFDVTDLAQPLMEPAQDAFARYNSKSRNGFWYCINAAVCEIEEYGISHMPMVDMRRSWQENSSAHDNRGLCK